MSDAPHALAVEDRPPPLWARISVVWLVPVLALAVSAGIAWRSYSDRGVLITIAFEETAGIVAGQTAVRFRDVDVGVVERLHFSFDLQRVLVDARIGQEIAPYLDDDAQFWVARPQVSTRGISGIDTIVGGVYIEGSWDGVPEEPMVDFVGLEAPPSVRAEDAGTFVELSAPEAGSLAAGSPVLFRGIEVGRVEGVTLADGGERVRVDAFIEAPHDAMLTTATRFWNLSGFSVSLDTTGISLDVSSLAALVQGGLGFDIVYTGGGPIPEDQVFQIFSTERSARESVFNQRLEQELRLSVEFDDSVQGLRVGAPVLFRGLDVGEVESLTVTALESMAGTPSDVRLLTNIVINPGRLGLPQGADEAALDFIEAAVAAGLRARIVTTSMLTGNLAVELAEIENAAPAVLDRDGRPHPRLPDVVSDIANFDATPAGLIERFNALPIEELMASAIELMNSVTLITSDASTRATPAAVLGLIDEARGLVGSPATQAIPGTLQAALAEVETLVAGFNEGEATANLVRALEAAEAALGDVRTASAGLPDTLRRLDALLETVNALPLDGVVDDTRGLLVATTDLVGSEAVAAVPAALEGLIAETRAILGSDALQAAPEELRGALAALNSLLTEFEAAGVAGQTTATLAAAEEVAATLATELPPTLASLRTALDKAAALDLEALLAEARATLAAAEALLSGEALQAVPTEAAALLGDLRALVGSAALQEAPIALRDALRDVEALVADIAEGGAAARMTSILASAERATARIDAALPALLAEGETLLTGAASLDLAGLVAEARGLAATASGIVASPELARVPAELEALLQDTRALFTSDAITAAPQELERALSVLADMLSEIEEAGGAENLAAALGDLRATLARVETGLPGILGQTEALVTRAAALPLDALVAEARGLLGQAQSVVGSEGIEAGLAELRALLADTRALIGSEAVQAAPVELRAALQALEGVLTEVRDGGSAAALEAALQSAAAVASEVEATLPTLLDAAGGVLAEVSTLPFSEVASEARSLLSATERFVASPDLTAVPGALNSVLGEVRDLVQSDAVQAAPEDLRDALARAAGILAAFDEGGGTDTLLAALRDAQAAAANVNVASAALPALSAELQAVARSAAALPLDALVADARALLAAAETVVSSPELAAVPAALDGLVREVRSLVASDAVQAVPVELQTALARVGGILETFEAEEGVTMLTAALADARAAAGKISDASAGLPALSRELEALAATAADLPLEPLVNAGRDLLRTADQILADEATQALPATFNAALDRLRALVAELERGGAVDNLNGALRSAARASDAVASAAEDLPALAERLTAVANQAQATLNAYDGDSPFNYDSRAALREIREAAEAIASLSRAIERRPNSILVGR